MGLKQSMAGRLNHIKAICLDPDLRMELGKLPKHELHVHLGGSIRRETALDLAKKNGVVLPSSEKHFIEASTPMELFSGDELWELFHNTYTWHWSCVKSPHDLERIVVEFLEDSHEQGVVHSEFTVSGSYLMKNFPFDEWTDAVDRGIEGAKKQFQIDAAAILDISRRSGVPNSTGKCPT